ncbi:hypothetical protein AVEN_163397-1, partial [Araneus ventricosus]
MTVRLFCIIFTLVYSQFESSPSRTETVLPPKTNRFAEMRLPHTRLGVGKPNKSWSKPHDTGVTVSSEDSVSESPIPKMIPRAAIGKKPPYNSSMIRTSNCCII